MIRPYKFVKTEKGVRFIYKLKDLRDWIRRGREFGDSGVRLVGHEKLGEVNMLCYKGFGVIANPHTHIVDLKLAHNPSFDGDMMTPEEVCTTPKEVSGEITYGYMIEELDAAEGEEIIDEEDE